MTTAMPPHQEPYRDRIELLQGTLDLLILTTLQWGPQHGYAISLAIKANSGDVLHVETGSLYPALHRLEKRRWVASEWKQTEANQRAKVYRLTAAGRKQLGAEQSRWRQLVDAMASAMNPAAQESES
jgi:PadR family transcriptional regulator PadR